MRPAYSVILFTTLSGAGYGLLALVGLFLAGGGLPAQRWFGAASLGVALALITAGLLVSAFHLGRPERAWRALSQWRSSWLSREGIFSLATYLPALVLSWGWVVRQHIDGTTRFMAVVSAVLGLYTVYCTAMIYATLRPIRAWYNPYTVLVYLVFAVWTGALWLNFLAYTFNVHKPVISMLVVVLAFVAWFFQRRYWIFVDSHQVWVPPENATGLKDMGAVRPLELPSTQDTYIQREMGFQVARRHATRLRVIAFFGYGAIPLVASLATMESPPETALPGALIALISGMTGTLIQRWLFFAEARHTAMLYFGADES